MIIRRAIETELELGDERYTIRVGVHTIDIGTQMDEVSIPVEHWSAIVAAAQTLIEVSVEDIAELLQRSLTNGA